jgi:hypothetical protein
MGIFEWLFGKNEKGRESTVPSVTFTVRLEKVEPAPIAYEEFTDEIAGAPVRAEVPIEAKTECERLLRKSNRSDADNRYLHDNYWVNVYYKNERHSYHGINDIWTYSARELPELPLLHEWTYSILGKNKPQINEEISTVETWEEKGIIHALGSHASIQVQVSFKPRGYVLAFLLKDELRWEDKASYNTKTGQADFPFYYSNAQGRIIKWGKAIFEEKKQQPKGIA